MLVILHLSNHILVQLTHSIISGSTYKIDANNIKLNVGKAKTDVSTHTWSSANTNAVTRATVYVDTGFTQHTATGAAYEPITGILTLQFLTMDLL